VLVLLRSSSSSSSLSPPPTTAGTSNHPFPLFSTFVVGLVVDVESRMVDSAQKNLSPSSSHSIPLFFFSPSSTFQQCLGLSLSSFVLLCYVSLLVFIIVPSDVGLDIYYSTVFFMVPVLVEVMSSHSKIK
jgi:hypothetical protein